MNAESNAATLCNHLVAVVDEVVQLVHVSLWLRRPLPTTQRTPLDDQRREIDLPAHEDL